MTKGRMRTLRLLAAAAVTAALAACAPVQQPPPATAAFPPPPAPIRATPGAERALLTQVAVNSLYEIEVSRLASARATSPRVRSLAQTLASHREHASHQLTTVMRSRGVPVPTRLSPDKEKKLQRLEALRPSYDFDVAYVWVVAVEDHETAIALLERARRDTRDATLAAWIDQTLPVMRQDLQAARHMAGLLAGSVAPPA